MGDQLIEDIKRYYNNFLDVDLGQLGEYYSEKIVFKDPIQELHGLVALQDYLAESSVHLVQCRFEYLDQLVGKNNAYLKWNMHFRHTRLGGKKISVRGVSQFQYDDVIYYHEDIYDVGSMVYEHVPGFGLLTRWLKGRLAG